MAIYTYITLSRLFELVKDSGLSDKPDVVVWIQDQRSLCLGLSSPQVLLSPPLFIIDFEKESLRALGEWPIQQNEPTQSQKFSPSKKSTKQDSKRKRFSYEMELKIGGKTDHSIYTSQRALIKDSLCILQKKYPTLLAQLEESTRKEGKILRVSRTKENLFLSKKVVDKNCDELIDGWYINVNFSWDEIIKLLKKSCKYVGIKYGRDLIISKNDRN
jgi:uncharacterized protein YaaR (DUF327 family)